MHGVEARGGEEAGRPRWDGGGRWTSFPAGDRDAAVLLALVAHDRRIPINMLLHQSRCRARVAAARHLTMYLMHVALGRSLADVARFFGRDRTTVGYACARIEDMRDSRRFDEDVTRLELAIAAAYGDEQEVRHAAA